MSHKYKEGGLEEEETKESGLREGERTRREGTTRGNRWLVVVDDSLWSLYAFNFVMRRIDVNTDKVYLLNTSEEIEDFISRTKEKEYAPEKLTTLIKPTMVLIKLFIASLLHYTAPKFLEKLRSVEHEKGRKTLVYYGNQCESKGVRFKLIHAHDNTPEQLIVEAAHKFDINYIVLGLKKATDLARDLRSTGQYVIANSDANVIVVKKPVLTPTVGEERFKRGAEETVGGERDVEMMKEREASTELLFPLGGPHPSEIIELEDPNRLVLHRRETDESGKIKFRPVMDEVQLSLEERERERRRFEHGETSRVMVADDSPYPDSHFSVYKFGEHRQQQQHRREENEERYSPRYKHYSPKERHQQYRKQYQYA